MAHGPRPWSTALPRAEGLGPHPGPGLDPLVLILPRAGGWGEWAGQQGPSCTWAEKQAGPCRPPSSFPTAHLWKLRLGEQQGLAMVPGQARSCTGGLPRIEVFHRLSGCLSSPPPTLPHSVTPSVKWPKAACQAGDPGGGSHRFCIPAKCSRGWGSCS